MLLRLRHVRSFWNVLADMNFPWQQITVVITYITSKSELDEYIENLNSRIAGIEERKNLITENFNRRQKQ